MMMRCQISSNGPPPIGNTSQLSRSKSLNDISIDSQISAFASDRFINLKLQNNGVNMPADSKGTDVTATTFIPSHPDQSSYIYNQNSNNINNTISYDVSNFNNNTSINNSNNIYGNLSFDNSRNLNNNQCSRPANPNVFNLCNPLSMNLSGVTEQIGNLHL